MSHEFEIDGKVGREDECYKGNTRTILKDSSIFNFSPSKRKLKFHIFNYLKFCFKILKI